MDFEFTEEQRMLRASLRRMLDEVATPEYVRATDREADSSRNSMPIFWASAPPPEETIRSRSTGSRSSGRIVIGLLGRVGAVAVAVSEGAG